MPKVRTIGALLKAFRQMNSLTVDDIAKTARLSNSTITKLERYSHTNDESGLSQNLASLNSCGRIAECMQMELSEFFSFVEKIEQASEDEFNFVVYFELSKYLLDRQRINKNS